MIPYHLKVSLLLWKETKIKGNNIRWCVGISSTAYGTRAMFVSPELTKYPIPHRMWLGTVGLETCGLGYYVSKCTS